jgi:hypothetical protein
VLARIRAERAARRQSAARGELAAGMKSASGWMPSAHDGRQRLGPWLARDVPLLVRRHPAARAAMVERRRSIMQAWADHCDGKSATAKVITFKGKR